MTATFGLWCLTHTSAGSDQRLQHIQVTADVPVAEAPIGLPVTIHPNSEFQSFVRVLPSDPQIVYCGLRDFAGTAYLYRYNAHTATWTLLYSQGYSINLTHIVDLVFGPGAEEVWVAVGTLNDYGESFHESNPAADPWSGIWHSVGGAALTQVNSGPQHPFGGGNINHPNTLTGLAAGMQGGQWHVWATHCLSVGGGAGHNSVLSVMVGATPMTDIEWAFLDAAGDAYCTLAPIQYHPEWPIPGVWFLMDFSGTGAYSFATSDEIISADVALYNHSIINNSVLSGASGGLFFSGSDKGFIYDTNGVEHVWQLTNRGVTITEKVPSHPQLLATRWGFAIHPSQPFAVIGYTGGSGADGKLVWTEDEGDTWLEWVSPGIGIDALDFGVAVAPGLTGSYPETLTFRDRGGYTGQSRFYTFADDPASARSQALAIASDIDILSEAHLEKAIGAYTTSPILRLRGNVADYIAIEERLVLYFVDAQGNQISVSVPAPAAGTLTQSGDLVDPASAAVNTAAADMIANKLCGRAGNLAVTFMGGRRVQHHIRRRVDIMTLAPSHVEPAE